MAADNVRCRRCGMMRMWNKVRRCPFGCGPFCDEADKGFKSCYENEMPYHNDRTCGRV